MAPLRDSGRHGGSCKVVASRKPEMGRTGAKRFRKTAYQWPDLSHGWHKELGAWMICYSSLGPQAGVVPDRDSLCNETSEKRPAPDLDFIMQYCIEIAAATFNVVPIIPGHLV